MNAFYQKYETLFNQRVLRERIVISCVVFVLVYFLADFFVFQAISEKKQTLKARYESAKNSLKAIETEKQVYLGSLTKSEDVKKLREIESLQEKIEAAQEGVTRLSQGLIPAEKLPETIRELLVQEQGLILKGLLAKKPEILSLNGDAGKDSDKHQQASVYKHTVVFRVEGRYFDLMNYLERLEKSPWNFYWQQLDYQVDRYPRAIAQIEAYTLSTERGFMGE